MKKALICAGVALLMTGTAFAQDEGKKDVNIATHKEMKKDAKQMKKYAKPETDTGKELKKGSRMMKKDAKKLSNP